MQTPGQRGPFSHTCSGAPLSLLRPPFAPLSPFFLFVRGRRVGGDVFVEAPLHTVGNGMTHLRSAHSTSPPKKNLILIFLPLLRQALSLSLCALFFFSPMKGNGVTASVLRPPSPPLCVGEERGGEGVHVLACVCVCVPACCPLCAGGPPSVPMCQCSFRVSPPSEPLLLFFFFCPTRDTRLSSLPLSPVFSSLLPSACMCVSAARVVDDETDARLPWCEAADARDAQSFKRHSKEEALKKTKNVYASK